MQAIILPIHLSILAATLVGIALADHAAFDWFRGKKEILNIKILRRYHWWIIVGLAGMIVTGVLMAYPARDYFLGDPLFLVKMGLVGVLIVNSFVIGSIMRVASLRPYASLLVREKIPLFASGAASAVGWAGAILAALFM